MSLENVTWNKKPNFSGPSGPHPQYTVNGTPTVNINNVSVASGGCAITISGSLSPPINAQPAATKDMNVDPEQEKIDDFDRAMGIVG